MGQGKKGSDLEDLKSDGRNVVSQETVYSKKSNWYSSEVDHFGGGRTLGIGHHQDRSKLWAWKVSAHET